MNGSRETICSNCEHFMVCQYKQTYMDAVDAIQRATINQGRDDGSVSMKPVSSIDFITLRDPTCKFFFEKYTCRISDTFSKGGYESNGGIL